MEFFIKNLNISNQFSEIAKFHSFYKCSSGIKKEIWIPSNRHFSLFYPIRNPWQNLLRLMLREAFLDCGKNLIYLLVCFRLMLLDVKDVLHHQQHTHILSKIEIKERIFEVFVKNFCNLT